MALVVSKAGWQGLVDELQLDLTRLPSRNLGRDDRIISSNGKETRYPFLSISVVAFLASLPVEVKVNPTLEEGRGYKTLLRMRAERMGLVLASRRKKRAMQFGSRSARMEGGEAARKGDTLATTPGTALVLLNYDAMFDGLLDATLLKRVLGR